MAQLLRRRADAIDPIVMLCRLPSSSGGHDKIVEMLLAKGANANVRSRRYGTALQAASSGGHDKIVEMFLEGQYTHGRRPGDHSILFTVRTSA